MFEKIFFLVKTNAGKAVIENPEVAEKDREYVMTEASSTIIDVLRAQIETGKMEDLVNFFQLSGVHNNPIVNSMVNKLAHRLNRFYAISPNAAFVIADGLIPAVMTQLVAQSNNEELGSMFTQLTGNRADLSSLVNNMLIAS